MKQFTRLLIMCLPLMCFGQNLVQNGHFTENNFGKVLHWLQPVDDYYHYEVITQYSDSGISYNAVNGICLLQPDKSEFLVIELEHPLEKGKQYCAQLTIVRSTTFIGKASQVKSIEMAFSDTLIEVPKRRFLFLTPRLSFDCIDENGTIHQPVNQIFEATGNERFLIIGKFHSATASQTFEQRKNELYREQYYAADSIKKYYFSIMPKVETMYPKRSVKKEIKKLNDSLAKIEAAKIESLHRNAEYYQQKIVDLKNGDDSLFKQYHVRLYLDNICITPVIKGNECVCEQRKEEEFVVGQTYRLNNIQFDLDKSTFKAESYSEMDNLYSILLKHPQMRIQLNGHTDSLNSERYNMDLSARRAKAVYDYLIRKGISVDRLQWQGYGESKPLTENTTEAGRAINRRVEFMILKTD